MLVVLTSCCPLDNPYHARLHQLSREIAPICHVITINKKSRYDFLEPFRHSIILTIRSHLNYSSLFQRFLSFFLTSHCAILLTLFRIIRSTPNCTLLIYGRSSYYFLLPVLFARLFRIPIVIDHTEWFSIQDFSSNFSFIQFLDDIIFRYFVARFATTHLSISFSLSYLLADLGFSNISVLLPRFQDLSLPVSTPDKKLFEFDFCYSGSLKPSDDAVTLMRALSIFVADPRFSDVKILLQLSSIPSDFDYALKQMLSIPQFTILGRLPAEKRSALIHSSSCALLTHSCQGGSRYNIPSRYNDYMLNYSIITSTRLISEDYIRHQTYYPYISASCNSLLSAMKLSYLSKSFK